MELSAVAMMVDFGALFAVIDRDVLLDLIQMNASMQLQLAMMALIRLKDKYNTFTLPIRYDVNKME